MKVLFFFVHPSKYHLFKNTFALLEKGGHHYDVTIVSKDVLPDLLDTAGIPYTNLFPRGRKIAWLPTMANAGINLFRTLWRLWRFTRNKKYDVFVTDDVLSFLGRMKKVPTIVFTDNDLVTIPRIKAIFRYADKIIAPASTDLGEFNYKKVPFRGIKALAHLHPAYFSIDPTVLSRYGFSNKERCVVRIGKLNANHDIHGNPGIRDEDLDDIIAQAGDKYEIILLAERSHAPRFNKYHYNITPFDFTQILAQSSFFIGDSTTMAAEAAVLGIPNIVVNNVAKHCGVLMDVGRNYGLHEIFDTYPDARDKFIEMLHEPAIHERYKIQAAKFIAQSDDFNQVLYKLILSFPER